MINGAAIGILFYARNALMGNDINRQRQEAVKANPGTTEKKLTVEGGSLSLLASPDGAVRSFYAADGSYHLVTTSETLARRFLAMKSGAGALGTSKEFRHARSQMPISRNDTVFVYLSSAFFRNMTGPQYRIETTRRLQAMADVELTQLARLTSATEGRPADSFQQLIDGGFLPPDFGPRPDGSQTVMDNGRVYDSVRGERGAMITLDIGQQSPLASPQPRQHRQDAGNQSTHDQQQRKEPPRHARPPQQAHQQHHHRAAQPDLPARARRQPRFDVRQLPRYHQGPVLLDRSSEVRPLTSNLHATPNVAHFARAARRQVSGPPRRWP